MYAAAIDFYVPGSLQHYQAGVVGGMVDPCLIQSERQFAREITDNPSKSHLHAGCTHTLRFSLFMHVRWEKAPRGYHTKFVCGDKKD